jgi:hypothetical protein
VDCLLRIISAINDSLATDQWIATEILLHVSGVFSVTVRLDKTEYYYSYYSDKDRAKLLSINRVEEQCSEI